jgi:hypothetical protein
MKKRTTSAIQRKPPEDVERAHEPFDRGALNALFKLMEQTEPALLFCHDALTADGDHGCELKTIKAALARIRVLKLNILASPAHAENVDFHRLFPVPAPGQKESKIQCSRPSTCLKNRSSEPAGLAC